MSSMIWPRLVSFAVECGSSMSPEYRGVTTGSSVVNSYLHEGRTTRVSGRQRFQFRYTAAKSTGDWSAALAQLCLELLFCASPSAGLAACRRRDRRERRAGGRRYEKGFRHQRSSRFFFFFGTAQQHARFPQFLKKKKLSLVEWHRQAGRCVAACSAFSAVSASTSSQPCTRIHRPQS